MARLESSNEIISSVAEQYGALALIPTDLMCPPEQRYCRLFGTDKELLYHDDDHLNNHGSRYLLRAFASDIRSFLSLGSQ